MALMYDVGFYLLNPASLSTLSYPGFAFNTSIPITTVILACRTIDMMDLMDPGVLSVTKVNLRRTGLWVMGDVQALGSIRQAKENRQTGEYYIPYMDSGHGRLLGDSTLPDRKGLSSEE